MSPTNADIFALTMSKANLRLALSNLITAAEHIALTYDVASGTSYRFCGMCSPAGLPAHTDTALEVARKAVAKS